MHDHLLNSDSAPLNALDHLPIPGRRKLAHSPFNVASGGTGWDEDLSFNTQTSSQWDSLCHWQHQPSGLAYNGAKPSKEKLSGTSTRDNDLPTLDHWHARGGLVARGVLIDFKSWADEQGIAFHPYDGYGVTVAQIEAVAAHQGVEFRPGDVLVLRLGVPSAIAEALETLLPRMAQMRVSGVESSVESARWFWDKRFAAVASDTNAFEAVHAGGEKLDLGMCTLQSRVWEMADNSVLHEHFLGLFGLPIGELWDLERLAEHARATGRYSFMLTSSPLNVPCLVASPPNALAIF